MFITCIWVAMASSCSTRTRQRSKDARQTRRIYGGGSLLGSRRRFLLAGLRSRLAPEVGPAPNGASAEQRTPPYDMQTRSRRHSRHPAASVRGRA
jgi:hypothetical protein